jgi:hypothetical protein
MGKGMGESSGHWLARAQDGVTIFLGVVIEAAPFLLLGVLVSQVLAVAVSRDRLVAWLPRGRLTSLTALAGLGAAFPVCECGNVPVARRLIGRGIFLIPCWSGEVLSVAFAIDCHDREILAWKRPRGRSPGRTFARSWTSRCGPASVR